MFATCIHANDCCLAALWILLFQLACDVCRRAIDYFSLLEYTQMIVFLLVSRLLKSSWLLSFSTVAR